MAVMRILSSCRTLNFGVRWDIKMVGVFDRQIDRLV